MIPEITKDNISIDPDIQVDADIGQEILVYIETWFDVESKFGIVLDDDDTWLNIYGRYNPFADTLHIECEISRQYDSDFFDYSPSESEAAAIREMIREEIVRLYHQTPEEFCTSFSDNFSLK